jgi:hypothetical protein
VGTPRLTADLIRRVASGTRDAIGAREPEALERQRDDLLLDLVAAKSKAANLP